MMPLLRNKEKKKYVESIQVRENVGMFAHNEIRQNKGKGIRGAEIKARMPRYLAYSRRVIAIERFSCGVPTMENGKPPDFHRPSADNAIIIIFVD